MSFGYAVYIDKFIKYQLVILVFIGQGLPGTKLEERVMGSFNFLKAVWTGKSPGYSDMCVFSLLRGGFS